MSGQRVFISCIHAERYRGRWNRLVLRKLWGTGRPSPHIYPRIAGDFYIYAGAAQCPHLHYICDSGSYEQEPLSQADKDALLGGNNGAGDHFRGPEHHKSLSGRRCGKP